VGSILMDQDSVLVIVIESIAANVRPLVNHKHSLVADLGQPFRDDTPSESCSYH
jgi:hypothetical protein